MSENRSPYLTQRFIIQAVLITLAAFYVFSRHKTALFLPYDGAYMRQLIKFNFEWCPYGIFACLNPLQGLSGLNFPINYWLSPVTVVSYFLCGKLPNATFDVILYTLLTLEFFASMWFLATALDTSQNVRLVASWIGSICVMPFIVPVIAWVSFYPISGIIPYIIEHIAISNVMLGCIASIQVKRNGFSISTFVFAILLTYSLLVYPITFLIFVPLVSIFYLYSCVIRLRGVRVAISYAVWLAIVACFTVYILIYFVGLLLNTVPVFFNAELISGRPTWEFISIVFHGPQGSGWGNSAIYISGLIGALIAIYRESRIVKRTAIFYGSYCIALLVSGLLVTFIIKSYRGPSILYFEWFLWPLMFIYSAFLFEQMVACIGKIVGSIRRKYSVNMPRGFSVGWVGLVIPISLTVGVLQVSKPRKEPDYRIPPTSTSFISLLSREIALNPGRAWRGGVATFTGNQPKGSGSSWVDNCGYDSILWQSIGNDHRAIGLWWYNIPTLFTYNQFMDPAYYYVVTRFFSQEHDIQQRSVVVLTTPEIKLLQLLGTRFIIMDRNLEEHQDAVLRSEFDWYPKGTVSLNGTPDPSGRRVQFLYELRRPNLGNYSPYQQIVVNTVADATKAMKNPSFDPEKEVVVQSRIPLPLCQARDVSFIWNKNEMRIRARSTGTSLLILPVTFSNCLKLKAPAGGSLSSQAKLLRANIALTGLLFSGDLDATLFLDLGPFKNVLGKIVDYLELKRIQMGVSVR